MQSDYYLKFENAFRGSRTSIIENLSSYDSLIDLIINQNSNINLLDIGCGRGEWLERCKNKIPDSFGIELDQHMINLCRENNLKVYDGDALNILSGFQDQSISIITIFHVIEHLDNSSLSKLIFECQRVLKEDGVLIMETPSIDNLLVSTKLFYLDTTHINHINPDGLAFFLDNNGFDKVKYFFINGGPLQDADFKKITRVLNGVGQDLLFVASKSKIISDIIFKENIIWQSNINIAPSTLEAAIDFDLERERRYKEMEDIRLARERLLEIKQIEKINDLSKKINDLSSLYIELNYLIKILRLLKKILKTFIFFPKKFISLIYRLVKKLILNIFNSPLIHSIIKSKKTLYLITLLLRFIPGNVSQIINSKISSKIDHLKNIEVDSIQSNQNLLLHYERSSGAKGIRKLLRFNSKKANK